MPQIIAQTIVPKYAPIVSRLFYETNIENAEGMGEDLHMVFAAHAAARTRQIIFTRKRGQ